MFAPRSTKALAAVIVFFAATTLAGAAEHTVRMLNIDLDDPEQQMVFSPDVLFIEPGDTVTFIASDKGHNSASKRGMLPEGAMPWNGAIDEEIAITFTVPGTYGYICLPHLEMGMVGLILVGDHTVNLETAKKVRQVGGARRAFRALFGKVDEAAPPQSSVRSE